MWFSRRGFLGMGIGMGAGLCVAGCGFAPAYAPGGAAAGLHGAIVVDAPRDRAGYILTREIEDRLGRGAPGRYGLGYSIALTDDSSAISADNVTTRYTILGQVTWALRDLGDGTVRLTGKSDTFTSYSASGSTVATQAGRRDAIERLMVILADQILTRLTAEADRLTP